MATLESDEEMFETDGSDRSADRSDQTADGSDRSDDVSDKYNKKLSSLYIRPERIFKFVNLLCPLPETVTVLKDFIRRYGEEVDACREEMQAVSDFFFTTFVKSEETAEPVGEAEMLLRDTEKQIRLGWSRITNATKMLDSLKINVNRHESLHDPNALEVYEEAAKLYYANIEEIAKIPDVMKMLEKDNWSLGHNTENTDSQIFQEEVSMVRGWFLGSPRMHEEHQDEDTYVRQYKGLKEELAPLRTKYVEADGVVKRLKMEFRMIVCVDVSKMRHMLAEIDGSLYTCCKLFELLNKDVYLNSGILIV